MSTTVLDAEDIMGPPPPAGSPMLYHVEKNAVRVFCGRKKTEVKMWADCIPGHPTWQACCKTCEKAVEADAQRYEDEIDVGDGTMFYPNQEK